MISNTGSVPNQKD